MQGEEGVKEERGSLVGKEGRVKGMEGDTSRRRRRTRRNYERGYRNVGKRETEGWK